MQFDRVGICYSWISCKRFSQEVCFYNMACLNAQTPCETGGKMRGKIKTLRQMLA